MLKVAKRKLKNRCLCCNRVFSKGDCYHDIRKVFNDFKIIAWTERYCPKCNYLNKLKKKRFDDFLESGKCKHPLKEMTYGLIAGEDYVTEPHGYRCSICGDSC